MVLSLHCHTPSSTFANIVATIQKEPAAYFLLGEKI
jgi:hypothetical protein